MDKFEMFSIRSIYSKYLDEYLEKIKDYELKRKSQILDDIAPLMGYTNLQDIVYEHILRTGKEQNTAFEETTSDSINAQLSEALYSAPYTEEELNHIYCHSEQRGEKPYLDIATKRFLLSFYGAKDIKELTEMLEKEKANCNFNKKIYDSVIKIINKRFETKENVVDKINEKVEYNFNRDFNCGGFALELYDWVLCEDKDRDVEVSKVLLNPSVRLLGDTLLQDDEYLVILDTTDYHFIKHKDGKFWEKMGACLVEEFDGWKDNKKEKDLVYFAVKKEHDMDFKYADVLYFGKKDSTRTCTNTNI